MTDKLEDTSLRLKDEMDLYRKMMDKLRQNRHQFQKEKEAMQEVGGSILCSQTHAHSGLFALLLTLFLLCTSSLSYCNYACSYIYTYKILHWHYVTLFICPFSVCS